MRNRTLALGVVVAGFGLFASSSAIAGQVPNTYLNCSRSDVKMTGMYQYSSTNSDAVLGSNLLAASKVSTACAGDFQGNDGFYPTLNLGYYGDGLVNGGKQTGNNPPLFQNGIFSDYYTPTNLNPWQDNVLDPGWIQLGSYEYNKDTGKWSFVLSAVGGENILNPDIFTIKFNADGHSGEWGLAPDATIAKRAAPLLGKNYFDQFAMVFKSADAFAAYDFTAKDLGIPADATNPIYNFSGTWDTGSTLTANCHEKTTPKTNVTVTVCEPAGLSHITIYARDPGFGGQVPEPGILGLLGGALLGLSWTRRRSAKS